MGGSSLGTIIAVIIAVILVDVFCGDVTNVRGNNPTQNNPDSEQTSSNTKSTTPWPRLGQRYTISPGRTSRPATQGPKKWIQQNHIWIRNEQASSGGEVGVPQNTDMNRKSHGAVRGSGQQNPVTDNTPRPQLHQKNRQQALIDGLVGNRNSDANRNKGTSVSTSTSAKPPLNRGDTYTILRPSDNRQQALINGLGGNQQNVIISSSTSAPTSKPMSYAGAVGPNPNVPVPSSPTGSKSSPLSPPPSPQIGGVKIDTRPSTGPVPDNNENVEDNEDRGNDDSGATDEELREFAEMLLRKDSNNAMKYVTLNLQGMTSSRSSKDEAPLPLLKIEDGAYKIPSIEKLMLLYNNYFLDAGQNEVYTGQERIEENNLLDAVLATPVMQFARSFLVQKGKIGKDPKEFKDLIRQIWFYMYSRGQGRIGSSGFEHVFLAEIKNNQVSGLHNWLYFNEEESMKRANYLGYLKKIDLGEKGAILKYHFTFHDIDKPVGSMFIGTSPELELALYSTCFILRADRICPLKMNGNRFIIRTYSFRYRGKNMIGSAFPEI